MNEFTPKILHGSCLCGGVAFTLCGPLRAALNCHCHMCQKAHAAAFRSRAAIKTTDFRWLRGEELIRWYESSPGTERGFCGRCGSRLITRFSHNPDEYGLPLALLDDDPGVNPLCHIHVTSKAPWHHIGDDLPQFAQLPPSR